MTPKLLRETPSLSQRLDQRLQGRAGPEKRDGQGVPRTLTDRSTSVNEGKSPGLGRVRGPDGRWVKGGDWGHLSPSTNPSGVGMQTLSKCSPTNAWNSRMRCDPGELSRSLPK